MSAKPLAEQDTAADNQSRGEPHSSKDAGTSSESEARAAAQRLLELTGVRRVVCVDDFYADRQPQAEPLLAALEAGQLEVRDLIDLARSHEELSFISEDTPRDVVVDNLRQTWDALDDTVRSELTTMAAQRLETDGGLDLEGQREDAQALSYYGACFQACLST